MRLWMKMGIRLKLKYKILIIVNNWGDILSSHFFFVSLQQIIKDMSKITFDKPFGVVFEGVLANRTVLVSEIRVLKSGKPSAVYNKEGERFNFEFLDFESKERVEKIVERNKRYI